MQVSAAYETELEIFFAIYEDDDEEHFVDIPSDEENNNYTTPQDLSTHGDESQAHRVETPKDRASWLEASLWRGTVASWLVRSSPDRAVRVRAQAEDTTLCSWTRHVTFTVPVYSQVYKWVPANLTLGVTL